MLSGLGLSSAFLDVFNRDDMRMVKLIKIFRNQAVYANGELR